VADDGVPGFPIVGTTLGLVVGGGDTLAVATGLAGGFGCVAGGAAFFTATFVLAWVLGFCATFGGVFIGACWTVTSGSFSVLDDPAS
jgi:hypothetical protein